jgi:hypothetical protein
VSVLIHCDFRASHSGHCAPLVGIDSGYSPDTSYLRAFFFFLVAMAARTCAIGAVRKKFDAVRRQFAPLSYAGLTIVYEGRRVWRL